MMWFLNVYYTRLKIKPEVYDDTPAITNMAPKRRNQSQNANNGGQSQSRKKGGRKHVESRNENTEEEGVPLSYVVLVLIIGKVFQ